LINFPSNNEELSLLQFLAKYQYLNISDAKHFFTSNRYYRTRIKNLITNKFIRKTKSYLVLTPLGVKYTKTKDSKNLRPNRNPNYLPRILYLSNLAAFYHNCSTVTFLPSFEVKDLECFTITSRRYIGILKINGTSYLTYHISKKHDKQYIASVVYDIQKEKQFENFIVLVDDISMINYQDFTFGLNQVLIVEDNEKNREKLKHLNSINWHSIIEQEYKKPYFSEHIYCDYEDSKGKYISYFYCFDTEKINRINQFLRVNKDKYASIICAEELKEKLQPIITKAKYNILDLAQYIEEKRNIYYE